MLHLNQYWLRVLVVILQVIHCSFGAAHPVSISFGQMHIRSASVSILLQVHWEDMVFYQGLELNDGHIANNKLRLALQKHQDFLSKHLNLMTSGEKKITGKTVCKDGLPPRIGSTEENLLSEKITTYLITYAIPEQPTFLGIHQTFGGDNHPIHAIMSLNIYLENQLLEQIVSVSKDVPYALTLNWDYKKESSRFTTFKSSQRTFKGRVTSKIMVDDMQIFHHIEFPVAQLQQWVSIPTVHPLLVQESELIRSDTSIHQFVEKNFEVSLNQKKVLPQDIQIAYDQRCDERLCELVKVGITLHYHQNEAIIDLEIPWPCLSYQLQTVNSEVILPDQETRFVFSKFRPAFHWEKNGGDP